MRLSVVVPVYNVARWLPACLDSVLAAAEGRDIEVISVDDGSTDASPAILARYPVTVIRQENRGYGAAVNAGLDAAKGEFVAIVEPDDRVAPAAWDEALALLATHPEADFARAPYWEEQRFRRRIVGLAEPPVGVFTAYDRPDILELPPAIWSGVYRRAALDRLNLRLPETPGAAFQDTHFSMVLMLAGASAVWAGRPFYRYRAARPGASRAGRRRTDELLRLFERVEADLPVDARARDGFAPLFAAARFRRLLWFFERVAPGYQDEAFRQAYLQFCPVWRDPALTAATAARLTPYQRRVFARFAEGRIDAFHREFGRPAPRRLPPAAGDFELSAAVRRDLFSLLPRPLARPAVEAALAPLAAVVAALSARLGA